MSTNHPLIDQGFSPDIPFESGEGIEHGSHGNVKLLIRRTANITNPRGEIIHRGLAMV